MDKFVGNEEQFKAFIKTFLDLPRHENGLPLRSHFQPMQHTALLPWFSIAQWHDENTLTLRLIGEQIRVITGGATIGTNMYDLYDEEHTATFKELHHAAITTPFIYKLSRKLTKTDDTVLKSNSYSIPVTSNDGDATFIYTLTHIADTKMMSLEESTMKKVTLDEMIYLIDMGSGIPAPLPFEASIEEL